MINTRKGNLYKRFLFPPFSVLDTMNAEWLERKRYWKSLNIEPEIARDVDTYTTSHMRNYTNPHRKDGGSTMKSQSIFDPVLCELMFKWFCPPRGTILDPFAGGSVRGLVAGFLDYEYTGMDLNEEQIAANVRNIETVTEKPQKTPRWIIGDSALITDVIKTQFDFLFSCPPYHDLEVYTNKINDISNMSWDAFCRAYEIIIEKSCSLLKDNHFACFVVSEIRGKDGAFKGLLPETIKAFEKCGLKYYNEIILLNAAGTLPFRISAHFPKSRKIGRQHQNILVFYKGDLEKLPPMDEEDVMQKGEQMTF